MSVRELTAMGSGVAAPTQESKYAKHGKNKERIKKRVHGVAVSKCSGKCWTLFSVRSLALICTLFWNLNKTMQDNLLWSLSSMRASKGFWDGQAEDGDEGEDQSQKRRSKHKWKLHDQAVCRDAFCSLLGISSKRLRRVSKTLYGKDGRSASGLKLLTQHISCMLECTTWLCVLRACTLCMGPHVRAQEHALGAHAHYPVQAVTPMSRSWTKARTSVS